MKSEIQSDVSMIIYGKFVGRAVKEGWKADLEKACDELAEAVAKKAERKTCKDVSGCKDHTHFVCSNCGSTWFFKIFDIYKTFYFDYCPTCGAEIEQEEDENENAD